MKLTVSFSAIALVLVLVGCGATGPGATPSPTATPLPTAAPISTSIPTPALTSSPTPTPLLTAAPLPTPTPAPSPTSTPIPSAPDALSIFRSAEEGLGAATTFHVTVVQEDSDGTAITEIDVLRPDTIRLVTDFSADGDMAEGELITIDDSQFILYPGFQGWFSVGETPPDASTDLGSFPYDLGPLLEVVETPELLGEEVLAGETTYHITGVAPAEFREEIGLPSGVEAPTMDIWVGTDDLLPRRVEVDVEDPPMDLLFTYSGYGARADIGVPPDDVIIDADYLERLAMGDLSPEEIGQLVRIFPVPGQQCIEEAVGEGLYSMMIGGDIGNNLLVWNAFRACAHRIFPFSFEGADS